ncbi:pentapeptide repeat-containing protein [Phycicoccus sp. Soil803]|uniref:pentapeptide repeat-containing protein n=1 Tax=Phycicoccus sp. Soil803 TaxID=1736415 RepID=UPI0012FCD329
MRCCDLRGCRLRGCGLRGCRLRGCGLRWFAAGGGHDGLTGRSRRGRGARAGCAPWHCRGR